MKNSKIRYVKCDDNIIINENWIKWIRKVDDCLYVCTKPNGCHEKDTLKICKINSVESYKKFNKYFE